MKTIKERTEKKKTSLDYKLRIDPSWLPDESVMEQEMDDVDDDSYTYSMEELDVRTERALQESREGKCILYDDVFREELKQMIAEMEAKEKQKVM